ncbi:putative RDD family membrane protein YckC [Mycolicibacterium sp. BK556]|uniref:RDD family protein n=1 Tax=Mycobacteriaceae TaxID=1762 RepID=UPI00105F9B41|nr:MULTISPECIES: RDD family protein [Mycobacteriaceae]MBB3603654.1 putative RDD family membrane protein YckC [Mycolicibacterium sp. BK556]MBB3633849.1 putative RDD family membrane protein YckC [Mycolicibacterium sp. BK607]MBB3751431.1 putative RDD family membrane protein YckC [Mycolicibacterium sp. BK634]TDO11960.1 RDD family protein [Mycobacterium sp. BK086]
MTTGDYDPNAYGPPGGYPPPPPTGQPGSYPPPPSSYPPPPPPQGAPGYPPPQQFGGPGYGGDYPPPVPSGAGQPGGVWIRFAARLIDWIITGIVVFLISLPFWGTDTYSYIGGVVLALVPFAYFVGLEVSQGATLGKKILKLQVHGPGGAAKPTAQQSAIRNSFMLLSIIPFVGPLLGFIAEIVIGVTINSSPTKQGKHDELAGGTQVVQG